jgi:hypothetical protein
MHDDKPGSGGECHSHCSVAVGVKFGPGHVYTPPGRPILALHRGDCGFP